MSPKAIVAAGALALALAQSALAGEASPKAGEVAPAIEAPKWVMNAPEKSSLEALRGEVVLLEKWGVKCPPCIALIPHIEELQQKHAADGLTIMAFEAQNHTDAEIKAKVAERGGKTYPVAANGAAKYETGGRVPHAWIIGVDGKVAWEGNPSEKQEEMGTVLEAELAKVKTPKLGRKVDRAVQTAAGKFQKRDYAGARKDAEKLLEKGSDAAKADAQFVVDRITAIGARQAAAAKKAEDEKRYLDAVDLYNSLAQAFKGASEGDAAAARLKDLKADDAVQKELKAAEALRRLCAELEGKPAEVRKAQLEAFAKSKKFEGTRAASDAQALAASS